jgi:hydroxymethylbilane synthase
MPSKKIRIGSRGSKLALIQANLVKKLIESHSNNAEFEINIIKTAGDTDHKSSLEEIGGYGVFTKKIESELLDGTIDIAVHSAKDLPSVMTGGLAIGAVPPREDCRDAWLARNNDTLENIKTGAVVGTSSPRRRAQLLNLRSDLEIADVRGNVETRLKKLQEGRYDALIMASAGLRRTGLDDNITEYLPSGSFIPAPGQGFLAIQIRKDDRTAHEIVKPLNTPEAFRCLSIERLLLEKLQAGCSAAVGGWARISNSKITLTSVVLDKEGKKRLFREASISIDQSNEILVNPMVDELISLGAKELIEAYE